MRRRHPSVPPLAAILIVVCLSAATPSAAPAGTAGASLVMAGCTEGELLSAIANANAAGGGTILFACQNTTISVSRGLGDLFDNVVIDGESKNIVIEYTTDFTGCATGNNGIGGPAVARLLGSGTIIRGLTFRNFLESIQLAAPGNTLDQLRFEAHVCADDAVSYIDNAALDNRVLNSHFQGYRDKAIQMSNGGGVIAGNTFVDCAQPIRGPGYGWGTFDITDNQFSNDSLDLCEAVTIDGDFVIRFERNDLRCKRGLRLAGVTEMEIRDNVIDGNDHVGVRVGGNAVASLSGNVIINNGFVGGSLPSGGVVVWESGQADMGGGSVVIGGQAVSSPGNNVIQGNGFADARNLRAGYLFRAEHNCWDGQDAAGIANDLEGSIDVDPFNSELASEICGDGVDNDCSGVIDDGCGCSDGETRSCGSDVGVCEAGIETCTDGEWAACVGGVPPTTAASDEGTVGLCNGLDDNCDGVDDEGCACVPPETEPCGSDVGECVAGTRACASDGTFGACAGAVGPAPELCDTLDNDCDGAVDEGCDCVPPEAEACGTDVGECVAGTRTCGADGTFGACIGSVGPAEEVCDTLDNDCDGAVDEGCGCVPPETGSCGTDVGECVAGIRACGIDGTFGACTGAIGPAMEVCDTLDNDCDGMIDEGCDLACPAADIDMDGMIDGQDLAILAASFGSDLLDGWFDPRSDFTGDGYVDGFDLAVLAGVFGGPGCSLSP